MRIYWDFSIKKKGIFIQEFTIIIRFSNQLRCNSSIKLVEDLKQPFLWGKKRSNRIFSKSSLERMKKRLILVKLSQFIRKEIWKISLMNGFEIKIELNNFMKFSIKIRTKWIKYIWKNLYYKFPKGQRRYTFSLSAINVGSQQNLKSTWKINKKIVLFLTESKKYYG